MQQDDFGLFDEDQGHKMLLASLIAVHAAAASDTDSHAIISKKRSADGMFDMSVFMAADDESLSSNHADQPSGWDNPQITLKHEPLEQLFNHNFAADIFDDDKNDVSAAGGADGDESDVSSVSDGESDEYECDEEKKQDGADILRKLEKDNIQTNTVDFDTPATAAAAAAGGRRKRIRPSRARNMALLEDSIQAIEGCCKIGMPMVATMSQCNTIFFDIVFVNIKLAKKKGDINEFTIHIPRHNTNGKDIRTLLLHRYASEGADKRIKFEHWTSAEGHDMYKFACAMTTHLNMYVPSQVRNVGTNGGQGGYMPEICFRYNCSKGKGSKAPMDMSMVVHMPEQEGIDRFCRRQRLALDACTRQRSVLLEFNVPQSKVRVRGIMLSCVLIQHQFTFQMRTEDRDACIFKIENQTECPTPNSDIIKVASNYVFAVESASALMHTDTTGLVLTLFRCVLSYPDGQKIPVLVQVSFYDPAPPSSSKVVHRELPSNKKQKKTSQ
jgi:hypothetical protein